jgi:hypothetical protein
LHLRAAKGEIVDLDDLPLLGPGEKHEVIAGLRWHRSSIAGPRRAKQQRRQSQPKNSTTPVAAAAQPVTPLHLA